MSCVFLPSMILFLSFLGPKDVTLSIKQKFPKVLIPSTNEKSSTKIFVLHPPDFLTVLLQYKFGDVPEKEDFTVSSRGEFIFFKLEGLFFLNLTLLKSSTS